MKIERKWYHLVLCYEEFCDMEGLRYALRRSNADADMFNELFDLYKKGWLQLWLRSRGEAYTADALDKLELSQNKVKNLYEICSCLCDDIDEEDIAYAFIGTLEVDGEEISNMEELLEHPSTELLDLYKEGTLAVWLRYNEGEDEADNLDRLTLSGDEVQDLYAVCQAVGIVITLEDIRNALEAEEKCKNSGCYF